MRSNLLWKELLKDRNSKSNTVHDVHFTLDGQQLMVASSRFIYVYSTFDGTLIQTLTGHKDIVKCIAHAKDGKRFATGSQDKEVIIWNSNLMGLLKFSHNDSIRCLEFNPITHQLTSCTGRDFGFWSHDMKQVPKFSVPGAVNDCSWTQDGHLLALALSNGLVSVRNRVGEEVFKIDRSYATHSSVMGVSFSPKREEDADVLAVVDQGQMLSFYDLNGKQIGKEKTLTFDPLTVTFSPTGDFMVIGGSNKGVSMFTKDGIFVSFMAETQSWVTSIRTSGTGTHLAIGTEDGEISVVELIFSTVHSLYKEHYAYRNSITDVIIQHLITDEKVRIKCRDLVKKLAIYKNRLAIQLSDKIVVYESVPPEGPDRGMHYKVKEKIPMKTEGVNPSLLVVGAENIVVNVDRKLMSYHFTGLLEREWLMDSFIRYVKATGGPSGKEGILIGLRNGQIVQLFLDNPFPIHIIQISVPIRCLDISMKREKLAVVDDRGNCSVYDIKLKKLLYQPSTDGVCNSVSWNSQYEDIVTYSGGGNLWVKTDGHTLVYQQQLQGFVVGFCGGKVFCLQHNVVTTIEISMSLPLRKLVGDNNYEEAFKISCLNVTDDDWNYLAHSALENLDLKIARKAFSRTNNYLYLDLINEFDGLNGTDGWTNAKNHIFLGHVFAYKGHFSEAVKRYKLAGEEERGIDLYTDLKMFDLAQDMLKGEEGIRKDLVKKKALWVENINEPRAAAEMYLLAGDIAKAVDIMGQHGWVDMLMGVVKTLDKGDRNNLTLCADYLMKHRQFFQAAEVYQKVGDIPKLASVYVSSYQWDEAFKLVDDHVSTHPDLKELVYGPYGHYLAEKEQFSDAQAAFHRAGMIQDAFRVLQTLTTNAIEEHRFNDAAYYCWILSHQCLELGKHRGSGSSFISKYEKLQKMALIYHGYHQMYRFIEEPFTTLYPDALFNTGRFLFHSVILSSDDVPPGVSKVVILLALSKQCRTLGAYKLARTVYEKLQSLVIPSHLRSEIEMGDVTIRSKPYSDAEDLLPLCYRCSTTNPLVNPKGYQCVHCLQPFIFSTTSFDVLPLIEFTLEEGISDEEAIQLLKTSPPEQINRMNQQSILRQNELPSSTRRMSNTNYETLTIDSSGDNMTVDSSDAFNEKLNDPFTLFMTSELSSNRQLTVDRDLLLQMKLEDVMVCERPEPLPKSYYRLLCPDMNITMCPFCGRFFLDDLESHVLQTGCCPFCRTKMKLP